MTIPVTGFYQFAYGGTDTVANVPPDPNLVATFNGSANPDTVLTASDPHFSSLPEHGRYITIGGGGGAISPTITDPEKVETASESLGDWTATAVQNVTASIRNGSFTSRREAGRPQGRRDDERMAAVSLAERA